MANHNHKLIPKALTTYGYNARLYNAKAIRSGDTLEVRYYQHPVLARNRERNKKAYSPKGSVSKTRRSDNVHRCKTTLIRKVRQNYKHGKTRFLTFTYAANMYDRARVIKDFEKFIRRYETRVGARLKYVYTLEKQNKRQQKYNLPDAPWHIHAVLFNAPFMSNEVWAEFWTHGHVKAETVHDASHCAYYIGKYITKDLMTYNNLRGFTCSRGLLPPDESIDGDWINQQVEAAIAKGYRVHVSKPYEHKWTNNTITYVTLEPPSKQTAKNRHVAGFWNPSDARV